MHVKNTRLKTEVFVKNTRQKLSLVKNTRLKTKIFVNNTRRKLSFVKYTRRKREVFVKNTRQKQVVAKKYLNYNLDTNYSYLSRRSKID